MSQPRNLVTGEIQRRILAALTKKSNASAVAREIGWSYSTVWRVAARNGIELKDGFEARGYWRLAPERRSRVETVAEANPGATQEEVAREAGVSRSTARRIMVARRNAAPG